MIKIPVTMRSTSSKIVKIKNSGEYVSTTSFAEILKSERTFVKKIKSASKKTPRLIRVRPKVNIFRMLIKRATGAKITKESIFAVLTVKIRMHEKKSKEIINS